jgi:hypothetical protein
MNGPLYEQITSPSAGIVAALGFLIGTLIRTARSTSHLRLGRKR